MAYTGNVVSGLPDWNPGSSVIAEPPSDKKLTGWQPDEKPPAQWFNWLNAGFYKSIKEIDDMFNKSSGHGHTGVDGDAPKLDPTTALAYVPVNKAGDTMSGNLNIDGAVNPTIAHITGDQLGDVYPDGLSIYVTSNDPTYPLAYGTILNAKHDNSRFTQLLFDPGSAGNIDFLFRHFYQTADQNAWTDWAKVFTDKNHHTYTPVALDGSTPMTGDLVMKGKNVKVQRPPWEGGWAKGFQVSDIDDSLLVEFGTHGGVNSGVNTTSFHYIGKGYNDTFMRFYEDKRVTIDGDVILGSYGAFKKLSAYITHASNNEDAVFLGSKYTNKNYGVGLYYGLDNRGNPYSGIASWHADVMHKHISFKSSNTGINNEDPQYPLDVGGQIRSYSELADKEDMLILQKNMNWGPINGKHQNIIWKDLSNSVAAIGAVFDGSNVSIDFHSLYSDGYKTDSDISFSIFGNGARPINVDSSIGRILMKGDVGEWALGCAFEGSAGTNLGEFGAHGTNDALHYYYIGNYYSNPLVKIEPSITTFNTAGRFNSSVSEALRLGAGASDHTYLSFYPRTADPDARGGYLGYGRAGTTTLTLRNAIGDINIVPQSGTVNVDGTLEATDIESNGVKVPTMKKVLEGAVYILNGEAKEVDFDAGARFVVFDVASTTPNPATITMGMVYDKWFRPYVFLRKGNYQTPSCLVINNEGYDRTFYYVVYELII